MKHLSKILSGVLVIAMILGVMAFPVKTQAAAISIGTTEVLDIDNVAYPATTEYLSAPNAVTALKFTLSKPSAMKAYVTWAATVTNANVWFSLDESGLNVIGTKNALRTSGSYVTTMLDPGTYYLCYEPVTKETSNVSFNVALISSAVTTTTSHVSSKSSPNGIASGFAMTGFLSATAPIDYYMFNAESDITATFSFSFKQYNGINVSSGTLNVYNYFSDTLIGSQKVGANGVGTYTVKLPKGTYYITLSGATTVTSLAVNTAADVQTGGGTKQNATEIKVNNVDYLDNVQYPETNKFTILPDVIGVKFFTLTKPTMVKVYMTWDTNAFTSSTVWLSRDKDGQDLVESEVKLQKTTSYLFHLLDPGTYYINYKMMANSSNKNATSAQTGICVLGEEVITNEGYNYSSSYKSPNKLTIGKTFKGFLSVTSPIDYYKLTIKEPAMVTFKFDFSQFTDTKVDKATIALYDSNNTLIKNQSFNKTGSDKNVFTVLLGKGTYYVSMSGAETTTLLTALSVSRTINVTQKASKGKVKLTLSYAFGSNEVKVIKGAVHNDNITDYSTWNGSTTLTGKTFTVSKNGWYTFRVKDTSGNYFMKKVKVTKCK